MGFDDFMGYVPLYVGYAVREQKAKKMSSPDKEKMDKKTQEFLDFVFKDEKMYKKSGLIGAGTNRKRVKTEAIWRSGFSYGELDFYRFKNGKINISKMSRCMGLSVRFVRFKLEQRGLL